MKVNNHGYPAGCTRSDIDLFHTVVDQFNSFSLLLVLNVLNASVFLCASSSIRFMWRSVQISKRHSVSSWLHVEPRLIFTRRCAASLGVTANQTIIPIMHAVERGPVTSKPLTKVSFEANWDQLYREDPTGWFVLRIKVRWLHSHQRKRTEPNSFSAH